MIYFTRSFRLGLALSGAIAVGSVLPVGAQITPDDTLGNEGSLVTPDVEVQGDLADLIEGGAQRGSNLFHSFVEFNVGEGQRVYFANPDGVESILSRITGSTPSNIFGTLGVDGTASLFLLNPNGIVFEETASLDVNGSFYATTAEAVGLGDAVFSATEPAQSTLLAIDPSIVFTNYLTDASGNIVNRGELIAQGDLTLAAAQLDIQGNIFVGSDLTLLGTDGVAIAKSRIGSGNSTGDLLIQGRNIAMADSAVLMTGQGELGNITLIADDTITIRASVNNLTGVLSLLEGQGTAGDIFIAADNLRMIDADSQTNSNDVFISTFGNNGGNSGSITLDVRNSILLDAANVTTFVGGEEQSATAGDIDITAANLELLNGAVLLATTEGINNGNAGNITINATGVVRLSGFRLFNGLVLPSGIDSSALGEGEGNAGNVQITAAELQFSDGAAVSVSTAGEGKAGDISLDIEGMASFTGTAPNGQNPSGLLSRTFSEAEGGDIRVRAANLEVIEGASLGAQTLGPGDAGDIVLEVAETVRVDGRNPFSNGVSSISASNSLNTPGDGSDIPTGDSGDIQIMATNLEVTGGGQLTSSISGTGNAGAIILEISESVRVAGGSNIISNIQETGDGIGGDLRITANNLSVTDGSGLDASVLGQGSAGNIILTIAETARFSGVDAAGFPSGASSSIAGGALGEGGNVIVTAGNLEVSAGAQFRTGVFGTGEAGDIVLNITETARFDGVNPVDASFPSGALSSVGSEGVGSGGDVRLIANNLEITNEAFLGASNGGTGDAGNIFIALNEQLILDDGDIETIAVATSGGSVTVVARDMRLAGDSDIRTNVISGEGRGGDITLTANTILALDDSDILAFSADGEGGDIVLDTSAFLGEGFQLSSQLTSQQELQALDGNDRVDVNATGRVTSGDIAIPDVSFIENNLSELSDTLVDTEALTIGSCIARSNETEGSFVVTGNGGLAQQPGRGDAVSAYPTGAIRAVPDPTAATQILQEPEGIYQLADGRLVLSHECRQDEFSSEF
ncbi:MAG: filamentous hemagglutinin N-terminal domain-containing protein [Leptolyngbyaceae cyanobacterium]